MKEVVYSDFDFHFKPNIDTGIEFVKNVESINQSIRNILLTVKGEVPFNPLFGSNINRILFEKISPVTEALLKDEIITALDNFEPRIKILSIICTGDPDYQIYNVRLEYLIIFLSISTVIEFNLHLKGL
jgi:phage baseplate assembly protein W